MSPSSPSKIPEILQKYETEILADWLTEQTATGVRRDDLMKPAQLRDQCEEFMRLLRKAAQQKNLSNIQSPEWSGVRSMLAEISRARVTQGFTPSEIALFIFSLKKPLFERLQQEFAQDAETLAQEILRATDLIDKLGLWTSEFYQKAREEVILRQQEEMLELSTPVVKLWDGILALPMIGTLDSTRTQLVMESLLQRIVETGSGVAIIDITGVPTVDTLVAQHLLKTVAAARLMGTDCIISGIRPQIAQTIVHLGVDLSHVATKATLADAFAMALQRTGQKIIKLQEKT